jgi:single-stranded-DNA-specific exonuclease
VADAVQGLKYRWRLPEQEEVRSSACAARFNLSAPIIQTLFSRRLKTEDEIERFLFSIKERDVAPASLMKDAEKAVERIIKALENKEKILICGDYDVDGVTSSSLMLMCLLPLGAQINYFLPNRVRDGYGLSVATVERAGRNDYKVIITVDNGITAFEPALEAKRQGIDLIITDHHRPHDHVPDAFAIINPHQHDCPYPFKSFAGVGVGFKLMSLLYERLNLPLPPEVFELLLLGTVADVVPLTGENRFWVRHGLNHIKRFESTALRVLKKNGRITKPVISSQDIGFFITPQINALGRLDDARDGVKFLMSVDVQEVERIGSVLASLNEARKSIEKGILKDIEVQVEQLDLSKERVIVVANTKWAPGVIGLAASRIVGAYHRPTFLFCITPEGVAKGSCRSIPAFNVFNALSEVKDLLLTFGGHAAAAGLSLPTHKLDEFKARMQRIVDDQLTPDDLKPTIQLDAELALRDVTSKLMYDLAYLEPFGCDNPVPLFYLKNVSFVGEPQLLKEAHVKCTVFADGVIKPVIFFNRPELFKVMQESLHQTCDVAVHVTENHWNNEVRVELQGIDILIK